MTESDNPISQIGEGEKGETETAKAEGQSEGLDTEVEHKRILQYCIFKTGSEEYALPIDLVKEVVKFSKPAPVPQIPKYILGMTNIRGNIYGVMDIERFFNIGSDTKHNYLLVLDHDTYKMSIGIPEVPDSLLVEENEIEEIKSSTLKSSIGQKYMKGIIKRDDRMIILFDVMGIIASENFTIPS